MSRQRSKREKERKLLSLQLPSSGIGFNGGGNNKKSIRVQRVHQEMKRCREKKREREKINERTSSSSRKQSTVALFFPEE